ncbi:zinc finger domain-containing protein, partial [Streptomyces spororaveus]
MSSSERPRTPAGPRPVCPRSSFSQPLAKQLSHNATRDRFCDMPELAEPAAAVEQFDCPTCEVPAGSTCRTRGGKVAPKYHTPRF